MHAFIYSPRLLRHSFAVSMLLLALQRSPMVRWLASLAQPTGLPQFGQVLRASAIVATTLGAVDTLVGATQFSQAPANPVTGTVGASLSVTFTITGAPTPVRSFRIGGLIPPGMAIAGLSNSIVNNANPVITGVPTTAGSYTVTAIGYDANNATGHTDGVTRSINFTIAGAPVVPTAPTITTQPLTQTVNVGATATLSVAASGTAPLAYQWWKNGTAIAGATGATLVRSTVTLADTGNYTVTVTNSVGTATSGETYFTVDSTAPVSTETRLVNLSVRMPVGASAPLIAGFVISGTTPKKVLIRAVGPGLLDFGVPTAMADPQLEVYFGQTKIHQSDNWDASIGPAFTATYAFPLKPASKDAALVMTLDPGNYTAMVRGVGTSTGEVLVEVYEVP